MFYIKNSVSLRWVRFTHLSAQIFLERILVGLRKVLALITDLREAGLRGNSGPVITFIDSMFGWITPTPSFLYSLFCVLFIFLILVIIYNLFFWDAWFYYFTSVTAILLSVFRMFWYVLYWLFNNPFARATWKIFFLCQCP